MNNFIFPKLKRNSYTSCEKGTIENNNGLIRRFLPKGKEVDSYDEDTILGVELGPVKFFL